MDIKKQKTVITLLRWTINLLPVIFFAYLSYRYLAVGGHIRVSTDFSRSTTPTSIIDDFTPRGRSESPEKDLTTGDTYQRISGEPTYMTVEVPRSFDRADVTLEYKNPSQPLIEFGIVSSEEPWVVDLYPVESKLIDQALEPGSDWLEPITDNEGVTLLQREADDVRTFESLQDFTNELPSDKRIATYRTDLTPSVPSPAVSQEASPFELPSTLRGAHRFLLYYPSNQAAEIALTVQDLNTSFDADPVTVQLKSLEGDIIAENSLEDDGEVTATASASDERTIEMDLPTVEAGIYELVVNTNDDITITAAAMNTPYVMLHRGIHLYINENSTDTEPVSTTLYMEAATVSMIPRDLEALQTVAVGDNELVLDEQFSSRTLRIEHEDAISTQHDLQTLSLLMSNLQITTDGVIAFTREAYFDYDAQIEQLDSYTDIDDLDYIVYMDYISPEEGRLRNTQTVTIPLTHVFGDRKTLQFVLSAPSIRELGNEIIVEGVQYDLYRQALHTRVLNRLKK